jgi:ubiquinone/menaquinone biosynthesis C-methylase UbiE
MAQVMLPVDGPYPKSYYEKRIQYYRSPTAFYNYRLQLLKKLCRFRGNERVLDIGCGVGTTEIEFLGRYGTMVGIDHNGVPLTMANEVLQRRAPGTDTIVFVQAKAEELPFKEDSFDMVICADFVEHISRDLYFSLLKSIHRVLREKGILVIYAPSAQHLIERFKRMVGKLTGKKDSCHGVNKSEFLSESLRRHRFEILEQRLAPTHIFALQHIERFLMNFSGLRNLFGRRICLRAAAVKTI